MEPGYPYRGPVNGPHGGQFGGPVGMPVGMPMGGPGGRPFSCPPARSGYGPPPVGPPRGFPAGRPAGPMGGMMGGPPGMAAIMGPGMAPGMAPGMGPGMGPGMAPGMGQSLVLGGQPPVASRSAMLLSGCYAETMTANAVANSLDALRVCLAEPLQPPVMALLEEIRRCSGVLTQVLDSARTNPSRVPVLLDYLELLLPCFQKSLVDIRAHYDDNTKTKDIRWRTMYHKMTEEAGGIPLPQIFTLYHQFILLLGQMLTRSPSFDMNALEVLQQRIEQLREKQGLKPPEQSKALVAPSHLGMNYHDKNVHWAEDIFSRPLPCRTPLKHLEFSQCFGPWLPPAMPSTAKVLFRRSFDNERLTLIAYIDPTNKAPFLMIRCLDAANNPIYSTKGVHEVVMQRDGSCLVLQRWSYADKCAKLWAFLYFLTYEELVLFHTAFVALKADGGLTRKVQDHEFNLDREKRLFQAKIEDDGFDHLLIVYQDHKTRRMRLHVAIWSGELRYWPVWTAFVTHPSKSWVVRKGRRRIHLKDVQLYVFCNDYREEHMRQNKSGAFELIFHSEDAATHFKRLLDPFSSTATSSAPSTTPSGPPTSADDSDHSESSTSSGASDDK